MKDLGMNAPLVKVSVVRPVRFCVKDVVILSCLALLVVKDVSSRTRHVGVVVVCLLVKVSSC